MLLSKTISNRPIVANSLAHGRFFFYKSTERLGVDTTMKAKRTVLGRPPTFESPEQMQILIDKYFKDCEGTPMLDADDQPLLTKWGQPIILGVKPPTITGLALALGFASRLSLLQYQGKPVFVNTVLRAKARVEEYAEIRLFDRDGAMGAKFSLSNNFNSWSEKQTIEQTTELSGKNGEAIKTENTVQIYLPDNGRD